MKQADGPSLDESRSGVICPARIDLRARLVSHFLLHFDGDWIVTACVTAG
jgi:hypothetical protein